MHAGTSVVLTIRAMTVKSTAERRIHTLQPEKGGERETERERQRQRQRHRETETERGRKDSETESLTEREGGRKKEKDVGDG